MNWEPAPNGQKHCRTCGQTFAKTMSCACPPGMGAPLGAITPITTDKELDLIESELRSEAQYYKRLGRELTTDGTDRDFAAGLKAADVSLKFYRAYKEIVTERKGYEHDRWLVEQNRSLKGDGGS